jgi:hypothetical protein
MRAPIGKTVRVIGTVGLVGDVIGTEHKAVVGGDLLYQEDEREKLGYMRVNTTII